MNFLQAAHGMREPREESKHAPRAMARGMANRQIVVSPGFRPRTRRPSTDENRKTSSSDGNDDYDGHGAGKPVTQRHARIGFYSQSGDRS